MVLKPAKAPKGEIKKPIPATPAKNKTKKPVPAKPAKPAENKTKKPVPAKPAKPAVKAVPAIPANLRPPGGNRVSAGPDKD